MSDADIGFVRDMARGFKRSMLLKTAVELAVFTHVHDEADTAAAVAERADAATAATELLVNALVAADLLETEGGAYRNTEVATAHLVNVEPAYKGEYVEYTTSTVPYFMDLPENVRRGHAPAGGVSGPAGRRRGPHPEVLRCDAHERRTGCSVSRLRARESR